MHSPALILGNRANFGILTRYFNWRMIKTSGELLFIVAAMKQSLTRREILQRSLLPAGTNASRPSANGTARISVMATTTLPVRRRVPDVGNDDCT